MSAAEALVWVTLAGGIFMGGWRLLRALLALIRAMERVGELSDAFTEWTEGMREWQNKTETRIVRLETLQMAGDRS